MRTCNKKTIRLAAVAAFAGAALGGAGVASAREWEASGGAAIHYLGSPGLDAAATSDAIAFGELSAGVEVARDLPFVDLLMLEARWQAGSTSATDFDLYEASLSFDQLEAGARAVRDLFPHLRGFAHGDLGAARGALAIRPVGELTGVADSDWTYAAYAGAGLDLAIYQQAASDPHPDFAFGLRLEYGYQVTGAMSFRANAATPSQGAPLDARSAALGDLDASGAVLRVSAFGRW